MQHIESLRTQIASAQDPTMGAVAVSAISASLALSVLAMTLAVTARRRSFAGDRARLAELLDSAKVESENLSRLAEHDTQAYEQYRTSIRAGDSQVAVLRRIIESPLEAATAALRGLDLCAEAASLVPESVDSDLRGAAALLAGAVRAILLSVDVNIRHLASGNELRERAQAQRVDLEQRATSLAEQIIRQV